MAKSSFLLVRVWFEDGHDFRARLTTGSVPSDVAKDDELRVAVCSTRDATLDAIRAWLEDLGGPGGD